MAKRHHIDPCRCTEATASHLRAPFNRSLSIRGLV